jgi:hypothetical protein
MGFIVLMLNTHMEESYYITENRNQYTLYKDQYIVLRSTNKHLVYRYMYECQGLPVPDQYTRKHRFQDISVDKP